MSAAATRRRAAALALGAPAVAPALLLMAQVLPLPYIGAPRCPEPYRVSRSELLQAMSAHHAYSLTSTTTAPHFGAQTLLFLTRRRQREAPGSTQFLIRQSDWFAAHREVAAVTDAQMSESARAAFEHQQDALIDYGPDVVTRVVRGPTPSLALAVTLAWADSAGASSQFAYRDTLSVPRLDVRDERVVRFKLLDYDSVLVIDQITGIAVRPFGFFSALFAVLGWPDLKATRLAVSADAWQVVRGRVKVAPGISKTGMATIEPSGLAHEGVPPGRPDLRTLAARLRLPVDLRYGPPSCQARLRMRGSDSTGRTGCGQVLAGTGACTTP